MGMNDFLPFLLNFSLLNIIMFFKFALEIENNY